MYALALWQGSREIANGSADLGKVIVVITAMLLEIFNKVILLQTLDFWLRELLQQAFLMKPSIVSLSSKVSPQKKEYFLKKKLLVKLSLKM